MKFEFAKNCRKNVDSNLLEIFNYACFDYKKIQIKNLNRVIEFLKSNLKIKTIMTPDIGIVKTRTTNIL
jgi:hypothetical protein